MGKGCPILLMVSKVSVLGYVSLSECIGTLWSRRLTSLPVDTVHERMIEVFDIFHRIFVVTIFHCARNEEPVNTCSVKEVY
jgi:hypothetical protein